MKLWQKNTTSNNLIHEFTVGDDRKFDMLLAKHDAIGSIAHVKMLGKTGIIPNGEALLLVDELNNILAQIESGNFSISEECEDVHSQIEFMLTEKLGEIGKKVHTARSRNDQSLLDIKLFLREEIGIIRSKSIALAQTLLQLAEQHEHDLLPGYTHYQLAMPSSFGLWFGAYAESLCDDIELLDSVAKIINKNPLGSAAGYGSSFPIDREFTTKELGFDDLNVSSVYAQMTRGKTEKTVAFALSSVASTLNKLASDIVLYMNQEFAYVSFPEEFTTGSSIMPHKKNPDVWELIRAKCNRIQSVPNELALLLTNMPSGYHRDVQLTKEILFPAIESMKEILHVAETVISEIQIRKNIVAPRRFDTLFTVDAVSELVQDGKSFRSAYQEIGKQVNDNTFSRPESFNHSHIGSVGNTGMKHIKTRLEYRQTENQNQYRSNIKQD
jgi:argininosuccinate lyase